MFLGSQPINSYFAKTPKVESSTPSEKGSACVGFVTPSGSSDATAVASSSSNEFDIYSVITIHSSASNSPVVETKKNSHGLFASSGKAPLHPNRRSADATHPAVGIGARVSPYFANVSASVSVYFSGAIVYHEIVCRSQ